MSISHLNRVLAEPKRLASLRVRFAAKVDKRGPDECWPWTAKAVARNGYGRMTAGRGNYLRTHQVAWALENGPIPGGADILHRCDNPPCCNPGHLFSGSALDNVHDAMGKGRMVRPPMNVGERHGMSKLTAEAVVDIRSSRETLVRLAEKYDVSKQSIWRARHGRTWSHVK